ncbi:MAG: methyltransferase domain-containing protein, partial [Candidatus Electrothrix sp. MAN1_4]|nr:methyltransferase domain-containing protein [Candidatus Electrothrix sp. MAN1_4]
AQGLKGCILSGPGINLPGSRLPEREQDVEYVGEQAGKELVRPVIVKHDSLFQEHWKSSILGHENLRSGLQEHIEKEREKQTGHKTDASSGASIDWGELRRLEPVSSVWGLDRGKPIDRYYIENFLKRKSVDITGRVLEVKDPTYSKIYGTDVEKIDILDIAEDNPNATLIRDLQQKHSLPANRYDCFVLIQTIHIIYDIRTVVENVYQTLCPGGVVLATLPCVSRIDYESGVNGDCWRFTAASAQGLFEEVFGKGQVEVQSHGNVAVCCGFLQGISTEELTSEELDHNDPYFPLILTIRAVKPVKAYPQDTEKGVQAGHAVSVGESTDDFRVIALIAAYNEVDVISSVIGHLVDNGIEVYLIDNRSTDDTVKEASTWLGRGLIG